MYGTWIFLILCRPALTLDYWEQDNLRTHCSHLSAYWVSHYKSKCYTLISKELTWHEAKERCQSRDGMLWKMDDEGLEKLVSKDWFFYIYSNLTFSREIRSVWAGAFAQFRAINYWMDGSPILLDYWDDIQKHVSKLKHAFSIFNSCMVVRDNFQLYIANSVFWEEEECTKTYLSICEHANLTTEPANSTSRPLTTPELSTSTRFPMITTAEKTATSKKYFAPAQIHQVTFKNYRILNGELYPRLRNLPDVMLEAVKFDECNRRCSRDPKCKLINVSKEEDCLIYYDKEKALEGSSDSVQGWSLWGKLSL